jgi:hypothetical protein
MKKHHGSLHNHKYPFFFLNLPLVLFVYTEKTPVVEKPKAPKPKAEKPPPPKPVKQPKPTPPKQPKPAKPKPEKEKKSKLTLNLFIFYFICYSCAWIEKAKEFDEGKVLEKNVGYFASNVPK